MVTRIPFAIPAIAAILVMACVRKDNREIKPTLSGSLKHDADVTGLRFSSDGLNLTTIVGPKELVREWNLKDPKKSRTFDLSNPGIFKGHAYSSNGEVLLTHWTVTVPPPDRDKQNSDWVRVWDLNIGKEKIAYRGRQLHSPALSPDGKILAVIEHFEPLKEFHFAIKLLDVSTGMEMYAVPAQSAKAFGLSFSNDSKTLAIETNDHRRKLAEVVLWDIATRKVRATLTSSLGLMSVLFSPDGETIASWSSNEHTREPLEELKVELKLWDVATGLEKANLKAHKKTIYSAAFSPDGRFLATGTGSLNLAPILDPTGLLGDAKSENELKLWDVATGKERWNLSGHKESIYIVVFSPDSRLLASSTGNRYAERGKLVIWDTTTGKRLTASSWGLDPIGSLAFSPDGKTLATGTRDGVVRLWDLSGRTPMQ